MNRGSLGMTIRRIHGNSKISLLFLRLLVLFLLLFFVIIIILQEFESSCNGFVDIGCHDIIFFHKEKGIILLHGRKDGIEHPCKVMLATCCPCTAFVPVRITLEILVEFGVIPPREGIGMIMTRIGMQNGYNVEFRFETLDIIHHFGDMTIHRNHDRYTLRIDIRLTNTLHRLLEIIYPFVYHINKGDYWIPSIQLLPPTLLLFLCSGRVILLLTIHQ
mmetsp:Transcript_16848/g.28594  ORF Transcript_16848/g.28594 Transcript_16848/m.28594 type:complete len:218 (-) Transcript_16848:106-759(-)